MPPENSSSQSGIAAWVALAVAVIGVIGTYIGTQGSTAQKQLEIDREKLRIEQDQEKLTEERKDRYMEMVRAHEDKLRSMDSVPHWRLVFENGCKKSIRLAVEYGALDSESVVEGWWLYEPGEKAPIGSTTARNYMFYAEDADDAKQHVWNGPQHLKTNRAAAFFYIMNHEFEAGWYPLPNEELLGFKQGHIDRDTYGDEVVKFTCQD